MMSGDMTIAQRENRSMSCDKKFILAHKQVGVVE
jgi:hypothetical protein